MSASTHTPDPQQALVEALLTMAELLVPVREAVDGYRSDLIRNGYSPEAAESMAVGYHNYFFAMLAIPGVKDEGKGAS